LVIDAFITVEQQTLDFNEIVSPPAKAEVSAPVSVENKAPRIFTVSELVGGVRQLLERNFNNIWVAGEVSNFRISPSGHTYFVLKDEKAVIKCALFKGHASKIKFQIKDGIEIICRGNLSIYEKGGDFNLIVDYCEPKGVGALQLAFEQLKEKLFKEGLFDPKHKKPLPFLPKKIGIVTSPTGAAIRDILNVLSRRYPGIEVLLYPVRVQGDGAAPEIAQATIYFNTRDDIDVMIMGRGGGSLEDLWAFNEEVVARAVFASRIPVISAVGHEIDFTISDFVADKRAPTPSAAAEIAVPKKDDLLKFLKDKHQQLLRALSVCLDIKIKLFSQTASHLKPPTARFPDLIIRIDSLRERLNNVASVLLARLDASFRKLAAELNHLSPLSVLSKGYSVVTKKGSVVNDAAILKKGDSVHVRFFKGGASAKIDKIN